MSSRRSLSHVFGLAPLHAAPAALLGGPAAPAGFRLSLSPRQRRAGRLQERATMERFEPRTLLAAVFWDGGASTNNWGDAANWNRGGADTIPQTGDMVTISIPATNPTISFNVPSATLLSLNTSESINVNFGSALGLQGGGTAQFTSAAALTILGGTISGGTWDVTAGSLHGSPSGGFITDSQITGDIQLDTTSAAVRITGSTRFTAARLTANNAGIQFAPGYTLSDLVVAEGAAAGQRNVNGAVGGSGTLTIAPTGVIRLAAGSGGNLAISNSSVLTLTNNGLIAAEAAGRTLIFNNSTVINNASMTVAAGTLDISPTNFTNTTPLSVTNATLIISATNWSSSSAISATGSTLTLGGAWSSTGTITVNNTTVTLGGTFTTGGFTLARTGGIVNLTGTLNNTGNTFTFNATTGSWNFLGGTVTGGTIAFTGADRLIITNSGGILTDVQVNGDLLMDTTSANVRVIGTTRFAAARLTANNAGIQFAPGYTLSDLVVVEGAAAGQRVVTGAVGGIGTLTIAPTGVIRLAAGSGGNLAINNSSVLTLINNGTISAEAASRTLSFNNTTFTNNASLTVTAGTLDISPTNFANSSPISATNVTLNITATNWSNSSAISATGSTLTLGGAWSSTGTITVNNTTLNLGGTFTAGGFTLARTGGTVNLTGTLNNTGNTFTFNATTGSWNFLGGTVTGGTIVFTGADRLVPTTSGGFLTDVQVNGDLVMDTTSANVRITGTTRFTAARLTANNAGIQFAPGYTLSDLVVVEGAATGQRVVTGAVGGTGTLTVAPTGVIRLAAGSGGNLTINNSSVLTLINNGLISAEAGGRTLFLNNTTVTNNATMQVTSGAMDVTPTNFTNAMTGTLTAAAGTTLSIAGNWSNAGTITVTNATLNLGGTFTISMAGTLNRTGGTVNLNGTLNNTGNTFTFNATTGSWNLMGGTVTGGTIVFSGADRLALTSTGGFLTDVQVNGELLLDTTSSSVRITGSTRFTAARLTANAVGIQFAPGYTLSDLVVAEGATAGQRFVTGAVGGTGTLTIAPTGVIRLAAGSGGNLAISNSNVLTLINNGLISAEAGGRTLIFNNTTVTNNAAIQVTSGSMDVAPANFTNAMTGTLTAASGTTLTITGNWSNLGAITVTNATLNLSGTFSFSTAGTINRTGGTVNLTGTLNNTGNTFTFNAATGSWNLLGGSVNGGTINFTGADRLVTTSSGGILTDVQVNGDLLMDATSASVRAAGTTRFTAARLTANATSIQFVPGYTLFDLVVAEGAATGQRSVTGAVGGAGTLTIAPTGVIRLAAGSGGGLSIANSSVVTLINNGTIAAEAAGRSIIISVTTVMNINAGTLTGGTWIASGSSAITFSPTLVITTNNAAVTVGGANSFPALATLATNNGALSTAGGGTFTITPAGGTLTNHSTISLAPGNTIAVTGNVVFTGKATLNVQVQGTTPATIGHLNATGSATLSGTVNVVTVNGFDPTCINSPFINAAITIDQFTTQNLPTPHMGMQAFLVYIGGEVRFAISPPSDYNRDGFLNSQDVFDFLSQFFTQSAAADFNHDGFVNSQDFFDFIADFFLGCP